jgi:hypothetical protein
MHDDPSSPDNIVSQEAICVNGENMRCVHCDEPILDLEYAVAAHPGYDLSKRIAVIVHEWCAYPFIDEFAARHRRSPLWYGASARELLYDPPTYLFLARGPWGSSPAQYRRLEAFRREL